MIIRLPARHSLTVLSCAAIFALGTVQCAAATNAPFKIQQHEGVSWLTRPDGSRFFSLGVCVVNQGASPKDYQTNNPGYAAFQHYKNSNQWAKATLERFQRWNFTTVGGWSDYLAFTGSHTAPITFTPVLHVGSTAGVPWWDMWDTNIIARMHGIARDQILPLRDDKRLLGYYSDNEMGWWNAILFKMTLEHAPTSGQRQRLIQLLRESYPSWTELTKDFEPENVASFDELQKGGMLYLRPGSKGIRTYRRFLSLSADRYYSLVREIIRTYDTRGLVLGDRYQSFFYPEVARACAAHVDAVSANLNSSWNDGTFARHYLDSLHELTGKPIFVSEFYMAATENRSGNTNGPGTFPTARDQSQRAAGCLTTLEALARTPYIVGADWFQYYDEPTHGRFDGENFNFGLVDIHDRPYEALTRVFAQTHVTSLKARPIKRVDASQGIPPAPSDPLAQFKVSLALKHWDRERGFVKAKSESPQADLYACWDAKTIFLGVYAQDIVETAFYKNNTLPEQDLSEWTISIAGAKPIRIRIHPGAVAVCDEPSVRAVSLTEQYLNTRSVVAVAVPTKLFSRARLKPGDQIEFTSTFFTQCRWYRTDWSGAFTLRR